MKFLRTVHPFPARMASEVVWKQLGKRSTPLTVLDPMAGSGTTLVTARLRGHQAIGFDRDPLAILMSRTWSSNFEASRVHQKAEKVLRDARKKAVQYQKKQSDVYPSHADEETKAFIRFWFDTTNRMQLTALSSVISRLPASSEKNLLWCAFSRLIITKKVGASLAMDVSHSRPHRKYKEAPIKAFDRFMESVKQITSCAPFSTSSAALKQSPIAKVRKGDARRLPLKAESIDVVITSPPYLNAIDYIRGHKLSLVWMGHTIDKLRELRANNIGTEKSSKFKKSTFELDTVKCMCSGSELSDRNNQMLTQYVKDIRAILLEIQRVLKPSGKAIIVVGDCNIRSTFVENSIAIQKAAEDIGLKVKSIRKRPLPENRRYLPPPTVSGAGKSLQKRMREEVILILKKPNR